MRTTFSRTSHRGLNSFAKRRACIAVARLCSGPWRRPSLAQVWLVHSGVRQQQIDVADRSRGAFGGLMFSRAFVIVVASGKFSS